MKRTLLSLAVFLVVGCGDDGSGATDGSTSACDPGQYSTANSGGLCQVNFFGAVEEAVYCSMKDDGSFDCACGAAVDTPSSFVSSNFCDLEGDAQACAAIQECGFTL